MRKSQRIAQEESFRSARAHEKAGSLEAAIKGYEMLLKKNPGYTEAISRLLILYRKKKSQQKEVQLLESAIAGRRSRIEGYQREWVYEHKQMADLSRPLAKMLGLLNENDLPAYPDEVLSGWETRLQALKKRVSHVKKSARTEKDSDNYKKKKAKKD